MTAWKKLKGKVPLASTNLRNMFILFSKNHNFEVHILIYTPKLAT